MPTATWTKRGQSSLCSFPGTKMASITCLSPTSSTHFLPIIGIRWMSLLRQPQSPKALTLPVWSGS